MGFNSGFKGLKSLRRLYCYNAHYLSQEEHCAMDLAVDVFIMPAC
jgi:hypothetical protein